MVRPCIVLTFILFCSCSGRTREPVDSISQLDHYFRKQFPANEPGGAVLVMKGSEVVFSKGYGLSDLSSREPVTSKTLFNIGSVSKTFVSNAILILESQGKLSVEDSLAKYFSF